MVHEHNVNTYGTTETLFGASSSLAECSIRHNYQVWGASLQAVENTQLGRPYFLTEIAPF